MQLKNIAKEEYFTRKYWCHTQSITTTLLVKISYKAVLNNLGMFDMDYINKFITAMIFAGEIDPRKSINHEQSKHLEEYYREQAKNKELKVRINKEITKYAQIHINKAPINLANQCHNISQSFFDLCTKIGLTQEVGMAITVGNVIYKGKGLYNSSPVSIKSTIEKGFQPDEPLDLHVWITLVDMSVLDLSIIPTLIHKGLATKKDFKDKDLILWRSKKNHNLEYIPMLHDDQFLYKVDQIAHRM